MAEYKTIKMRASDEFIEKKSRFIMPSFAHVNLIPASLGNSAGLLGANYLASKNIK